MKLLVRQIPKITLGLLALGSPIHADEINPLPKPGPLDLATDFERNNDNLSDETLEVLAFVSRNFSFYQDKDDPHLYWVTPRYGAAPEYPASQFAYADEVELNRTIDKWLKKVDENLLDRWDQIDNDDEFNDSVAEASDAAAFEDGILAGGESGDLLRPSKIRAGHTAAYRQFDCWKNARTRVGRFCNERKVPMTFEAISSLDATVRRPTLPFT